MNAGRLMITFQGLLLLTGIVAAPSISSVKADLKVPSLQTANPAATKRVKQTHPDWKDTRVYHVLHLPGDWNPDRKQKYPVIVEYAGNGPYQNKYGDKSSGHPEGSKMGYGLSGGQEFIWLCLPYLSNDGQGNVTNWWGNKPKYNPANTLTYAKKTVPWICRKYGGDAEKVFICGFSRGAIACNFIGLYDDDIAKLWCAFLPYSHYDGVRHWSYPGADRQSAKSRIHRIEGRPQFITHENDGVDATRKWIGETGVKGDFTFRPTGFRNHNDAWLLRPSPVREEMRNWMRKIIEDPR